MPQQTDLFRISHPSVEGIFEASKWISTQALLDVDELEHLIASLQPCFLINVSEIVGKEKGVLSWEEFFSHYKRYVEKLNFDAQMRPFFSAHITSSLETHYAMEVKKEAYLIKPLLPSLQLQSSSFHFERKTQKFHTMCFGKKEISWGLQFSYPALFREPKSKEILQTLHSNTCNLPLFKKVTQWMRENTRPTPFLIDGKKVMAPIRIGKKALSWVQSHLEIHGMEIHAGN